MTDISGDCMRCGQCEGYGCNCTTEEQQSAYIDHLKAANDAQDAKIKALVEALETIEGRIEQAANDFNDATRWPDVAHFMSDCTVMEWVMAPAHAAIDKTEETT